jgi:hypothetical protein
MSWGLCTHQRWDHQHSTKVTSAPKVVLREVLYRDEKHKHHSRSQDSRIGNRPALCTPVARMATSNAITTDPPAALAGIGN